MAMVDAHLVRRPLLFTVNKQDWPLLDPLPAILIIFEVTHFRVYSTTIFTLRQDPYFVLYYFVKNE